VENNGRLQLVIRKRNKEKIDRQTDREDRKTQMIEREDRKRREREGGRWGKKENELEKV
jgi:hypothetical protein